MHVRRRSSSIGSSRRARQAPLEATSTRESLTLYERLLAAREGVALAELEGKICQGCFMEVPSNLYVKRRARHELIQCPSCDRILYIRD